MSLDILKKRLRTYSKKDIRFNEPHFSKMLMLRDGSEEEVIDCLLNPVNLVYYYTEKGKFGDTVYCLHFKISNTRTLRLPVIFSKKTLYILTILTYIPRYRKWQSMVR